MDSSMVKGIVIGGIAMVVLGAGAVGYKTMTKPQFAEVVSVKEAKQTVSTPREQCEQVQVQKQAPVKDEHRVAGKVVGGVAAGCSAAHRRRQRQDGRHRRRRRGRRLRRQQGAEEHAGEGRRHDDRDPLQDRSTTPPRSCSATTSPYGSRARKARCAWRRIPASRFP
jgi:hypothetical protein